MKLDSIKSKVVPFIALHDTLEYKEVTYKVCYITEYNNSEENNLKYSRKIVAENRRLGYDIQLLQFEDGSISKVYRFQSKLKHI